MGGLEVHGIGSSRPVYKEIVEIRSNYKKSFFCWFGNAAFGDSIRSNWKQRTKVNFSYSPWEEILFGVPQRPILVPLFFNIFLCDLFFIMNETDFVSYANDNMPYRTANTIDEVIQSLEYDSMMLFQCLSDNQMKANISKCHVLVNKKNEVTIRVGDMEIKISEYEKLPGIKVDAKLNFNEHTLMN